MSANWYYLEDDDESNKKGPVTLEFLFDHVSSDCLISNDEMLTSDTPWMLLSQLNNSHKTTNSLIIANNKNHKHQNKQIEIKIQNMNNNHNHQDPPKIDIKTPNDDKQRETDKTKQIQKENEVQKQQKEQRKKQVLNLKSDESFDEEWFILSPNKEQTLGPFTRWQLIKKFNANEINSKTITFLNGSKQFRFLSCCGELRGLLPCIDRDAVIESDSHNEKHVLTKDELESKEYLYKDAYQRQCGPISLSEIFYNLEHGILGRNSEIKQENELCWKTVEFIQKKFSNEWNQMIAMKQGIETQIKEKEDIDMNISDVESDVDSEEMEHRLNPSFRALIDLDKKTQIEKKIAIKYPERNMKNNDKDKNTNKNTKKRKRKRENKKRKQENKAIYVSGLPLDITMYEMDDFFKKAGVIATDIYQKGKKMITLYEKEGTLKGDALVTYHQMVSVQLAMDLLDETEIRNGYPVHITIPTFKNSNKRKKRKLDKKNEATLKQLYGVDKQLTWNDDIQETLPKLQWIVLQNMWNIQQMDFDGLEQEVLNECTKIGAIDKLEIYQQNPKGIIRIKYKFSQDAAQCIKQMNRRYFDGNIVDCFYWDGKTDYNVHQTAKQQQKLFQNFQNTLQSDSHKQ